MDYRDEKRIQDIIDEYSRYGADISSESARILGKTNLANAYQQVKHFGDKMLNRYPELVKNNQAVFFPDGVPEDALDDYDEDKHGAFYTTLDDIQEQGLSPEDWKEMKKVFASEIIKNKLNLNNMSKKRDDYYKGPTGEYDVARVMEDVFGV